MKKLVCLLVVPVWFPLWVLGFAVGLLVYSVGGGISDCTAFAKWLMEEVK